MPEGLDRLRRVKARSETGDIGTDETAVLKSAPVREGLSRLRKVRAASEPVAPQVQPGQVQFMTEEAGYEAPAAPLRRGQVRFMDRAEGYEPPPAERIMFAPSAPSVATGPGSADAAPPTTGVRGPQPVTSPQELEAANLDVAARVWADRSKEVGGDGGMDRPPQTMEEAREYLKYVNEVDADYLKQNKWRLYGRSLARGAIQGLTANLLDPADVTGESPQERRGLDQVGPSLGPVAQFGQGAANIGGALTPIKVLGAVTRSGVGGLAAYGGLSTPGGPSERIEGAARMALLGAVPNPFARSAGWVPRRLGGAASGVVGDQAGAMTFEGRGLTGQEAATSAATMFGLAGKPGAAKPRRSFGDRIRALRAAKPGKALPQEVAGEIKAEAVAEGKAAPEEVFTPARVEEGVRAAQEAVEAGLPPAEAIEAARVAVEGMEAADGPGGRQEGYRATEDVLADPAVPEPQKAAIREAQAQGVETVSSHVDPATGKGVAIGAQVETGEVRRITEPEDAADLPEGFVTRMGPIDPEGAYFSSSGDSPYFQPGEQGVKSYDIGGAKIADTGSPEVARAVLSRAIEDPANTPEDVARLRQALDGEYVDYMLNDEVPSVVRAAKGLGYDGIKVWESGDVDRPSSVFLWNTGKAREAGAPPVEPSAPVPARNPEQPGRVPMTRGGVSHQSAETLRSWPKATVVAYMRRLYGDAFVDGMRGNMTKEKWIQTDQKMGVLENQSAFGQDWKSAPSETVDPVPAPTRAEVEGRAPSADSTAVRVTLDSGDTLTEIGKNLGGVKVRRTRLDGSTVEEQVPLATWRELTGVREKAQRPIEEQRSREADSATDSLSTYLRKSGGIRPGEAEGYAGETVRLAGRNILRRDGLSLDRALEEARNGGYLPEDATISDLLEAVEADSSGLSRVESHNRATSDREAFEMGLPPDPMERADVPEFVKHKGRPWRVIESETEPSGKYRYRLAHPTTGAEIAPVTVKKPLAVTDPPQSFAEMVRRRVAGDDVDMDAVQRGVDFLRGAPDRSMGPEAGAFDPMALPRLAGEALGAPRKAAGFLLGQADRAVRATARGLMEQAAKMPGVRQTLEAGRIAYDVAKEKALSTFARGREYVSRLDERRGEIALARFDAQKAVKDLSRGSDRKRLSEAQQETVTGWLTGDVSEAEAVRAVGPEYVERAKTYRAELDANEQKLHDLGWMSEETLNEWKGRWLPRVYEKVEQRKREDGSSGPSVTASKKIPGVFMRRDGFIVRWKEGGEWKNKKFRGEDAAAQAQAEEFVKSLRVGESDRSKAPRGIVRYVTKDGDQVYRWREGAGENMRVHEKRWRLPQSMEAEARQLDEIPRVWAELNARGEARDRPGVSDITVVEPIPKAWREAMGEVRDPAVLVARGLATQRATIATMELLSDVAANPRMTSATAAEGFHEQPVPNDKKRYGALAGKYLRRPIRDDIVGMLREKSPFWDTLASISDTALSQWKFGKTVMNPGTHVRNVIGNTVFGEFADFSRFDPSNLRHTLTATRILAAQKGSPLYEIKRFLIRERVAGGDFYSVEVLDLVKDIERQSGDSWGSKVKAYMENKASLVKRGRVMEALPGADVSAKLYQLEDVLPKMGAWAKYVSQGMSPEAAAARVREWFPNYGTAFTNRLTSERGFKGAVARQIGPAFHAFTAETARILGKAVVQKPVTTAALYLGLRWIGDAMRQAAGVSEEEAEQIGAMTARYMRPGTFRPILPWRGDKGEVRVLDLSWTLPGGNEISALERLLSGEDTEAEIGGGGVEWSPIGPFITMAAEQLFNRSLLTGKPIDRSTGEGGFIATSEAEGTRARLRRLGEGLFPSLTPGIGLGARKFAEAADQRPIDLEGKVTRDKALTFADVLAGLKVREINVPEQAAKAARSLDEQITKKRSRIVGLQREPDGYQGRNEADRRREHGELVGEILGLYNRWQKIRGGKPAASIEELPEKLRKSIAWDPANVKARQFRGFGGNLGIDADERRRLEEALGR